MAKTTLTKAQLTQLIKEEAYKVVGDAITAKMNQMDSEKGNGSDKPKVGVKASSSSLKGDSHDGQKKADFDEKKTGPVKGEFPMDVKLNQMAKEKGNGDTSAKVGVKAGSSERKGDSVAGQKVASFTEKDKGPVKGEEPTEVDMKQLDKESGPEKASAFVTAGAADKNGQKKPVYSDKSKDSKEDKRIAKGIVVPENFKTKKDLQAFILAEATKLAKLV